MFITLASINICFLCSHKCQGIYIKKKSTLFLTVSIKRLHLEVAFSLHLQIKTATQEGIKKKKGKVRQRFHWF